MSLNLDPVVVKLIGAAFIVFGIGAWAYLVNQQKSRNK
jgi:hypothetical protein